MGVKKSEMIRHICQMTDNKIVNEEIYVKEDHTTALQICSIWFFAITESFIFNDFHRLLLS